MEVVIFSQQGKTEEETVKKCHKFCEDRERYTFNKDLICE